MISHKYNEPNQAENIFRCILKGLNRPKKKKSIQYLSKKSGKLDVFMLFLFPVRYCICAIF